MTDTTGNDTVCGMDEEQIAAAKSLLEGIRIRTREQLIPEAVSSGLISQPSVEDDLAALRMALSPLALPDDPDIATFVKKRMSVQKGVKLRFDSIAIPLISLEAYISRLKKLFYCSSECFILALVYLDRLQELHDSVRVNCFNVHRLFLVALLVAVKFFDDVSFTNEYYAKVGGIGTK
ncbi:cyclin, partial [Gregarina niphandrodes]